MDSLKERTSRQYLAYTMYNMADYSRSRSPEPGKIHTDACVKTGQKTGALILNLCRGLLNTTYVPPAILSYRAFVMVMSATLAVSYNPPLYQSY
jgi:hypothetical protein